MLLVVYRIYMLLVVYIIYIRIPGVVPVSTVFIIGEFIMSISCLCSFPSTGEVSTVIITIFGSVSHL